MKRGRKLYYLCGLGNTFNYIGIIWENPNYACFDYGNDNGYDSGYNSI